MDISVAVATPRGLVVPVIRNAESMDYSEIERAIASVAEKARTGQLDHYFYNIVVLIYNKTPREQTRTPRCVKSFTYIALTRAWLQERVQW